MPNHPVALCWPLRANTAPRDGCGRRARGCVQCGWRRGGVTVLALLATACAPLPPDATADKLERFANAHARLLPIGRMLALAAERDARWPLGDKATMVSSRQLACMRQAMSPAEVEAAQRQRARGYALAHTDALDAELGVLEAGAARVIGESMLAGARGDAPPPAPPTPAEAEAVAEFVSSSQFARLRQATGLDALAGGAGRLVDSERGRRLGHALTVPILTDAFLRCHIPVKLIY